MSNELTFELNINELNVSKNYSCIDELLKCNKILHLRLIVLPSGRLEARVIFENFDGLSSEQKVYAEDCLELWKRHVTARIG